VNFNAHITRNPEICGGEAVIIGTRVALRTILASLAEGDTLEELLAAFPTLTEADIRAVIAYAASIAVHCYELQQPQPIASKSTFDLDNLDPDEVVEAIEEGRRRALLAHKLAGQSIAIWENGKVVIISPEEIEPV